MTTLSLHTAVGSYGHTKSLKDGTARSQNLVLEKVDPESVFAPGALAL